MFMLKSTHAKYRKNVCEINERLRSESKLMRKQIENLEKQLREAKRRDPDGKFKKIEGDFLTR